MVTLDVVTVRKQILDADHALSKGDSTGAIAALTIALEAVYAHSQQVEGAVLFHARRP